RLAPPGDLGIRAALPRAVRARGRAARSGTARALRHHRERPRHGQTVRGRALERGSDGEIVFRGPQVFAGYTDDAETAAAFHPGGWFRTGDIGRVDPGDGSLAITGRSKEVIITGGLNVNPREVELALETYAGVSAAAVVGVASER